MINKAGGFQLKEARKKLGLLIAIHSRLFSRSGGCATGEAKYTGAFEHERVRYIIHAVGPVYRIPFELTAELNKGNEADAVQRKLDYMKVPPWS